MNDIPLSFLFISLGVLILVSAFFSGSETSMMSINRYRLKNLVNKKNKSAMRVQGLLNRTDRLLSVVLIGNNFVNILASSIATVIGLRLFGDAGIAVATGLLTLTILIFAEITPKTMASLSPERFAFPASLILKPLSYLLSPFVWITNGISLGILKTIGFDPSKRFNDALDSDELRSVVNEAGPLIPRRHQGMLLNILDLEKITVDDIMVPRNEISGIDLDDDINEILEQLATSQHTRQLVYTEDLNRVSGIIHMRNLARMIKNENLNKAELMQIAKEPYFVPEGTPLHKQLIEFQKHKRRLAIVVDEYGDVQGIVTLDDILEEIVGEFTTDMAAATQEIYPQEDGSYILEGGASIREINRNLNWKLPLEHAKTVSGLLVDQLEFIPSTNICIAIDDYCFETIQIKDNMIKTVKVKSRIPPKIEQAMREAEEEEEETTASLVEEPE